MDQSTAPAPAVAEPTDAALRPLTLPAPPAWSQLTANKQHLAALKADLESCSKVATKLESLTDEPTWNAFIPFGPLAYFAGQLIHTNDITHTLSISPLDSPPTSTPSLPPPVLTTAEEAAPRAEAGADWHEGEGWKVLKSAKQARASALKSAEELETSIADLSATIEKQELEVKKEQAAQAVGGAEGSEDWSFNERGEVINEEGLPMFDIREELPAEGVEEVKPEPVKQEKLEQPKQQMRYLIKKGGKQVVKPLNVPTTPHAAAPAPKPTPFAPSSTAPTRLAPSSSPSTSAQTLDTKSILDALEEEEAAERELEKAREESEAREEEPREASAPTPSTSAPVTAPAHAPTPSASAPSPKPTPKPTKKPGKQFGGFSAGFLSKKPAPSARATPSSPSSSIAFPAPLARSTSTSPPSKITELDEDEPHHSPLHHTAPLPRSIVRPTPPPSRPDSPASSHRVKFDVPSGSAPGDHETSPSSKGKKRAIPLPPPPAKEGEGEKKAGGVQEKFERPIKEKVVEREVKPPVAPGERKKERDQSSRSKEERDRYLKTLGRPPKVREREVASTSTATATPILPSSAPPGATPIHTISLSAKSSKKPSSSLATGEISIADIPSSDEEEDTTLHLAPGFDDGDDTSLQQQPSLTSDGDSSSSDGFYASEDEDDEEEEFDIDAALHAREVALAYHDRRMGVGAGAGTGPLGGHQDPEAFDAWNQPEVPLSATLQGRPASHGSSSRFRTGRLESAQMIIPSLLAEHVREDGQPSSDEEEDEEGNKDGLTKVERERLRKSLEALGRGEMPEPFEIGGRGGEERAPAPVTSKAMEKAPPQIVATPISVPSNAVSTRQEEEEAAPAPAERPKKMSRFKARQLGLESDI